MKLIHCCLSHLPWVVILNFVLSSWALPCLHFLWTLKQPRPGRQVTAAFWGSIATLFNINMSHNPPHIKQFIIYKLLIFPFYYISLNLSVWISRDYEEKLKLLFFYFIVVFRTGNSRSLGRLFVYWRVEYFTTKYRVYLIWTRRREILSYLHVVFERTLRGSEWICLVCDMWLMRWIVYFVRLRGFGKSGKFIMYCK